jgi:hypothetical protein
MVCVVHETTLQLGDKYSSITAGIVQLVLLPCHVCTGLEDISYYLLISLEYGVSEYAEEHGIRTRTERGEIILGSRPSHACRNIK